jgi:glycosyltransferase involved in cell wall biosynthesis
MNSKNSNQKIAIILPAFNEEKTIELTIKDFHQHLPDASIYIIDNNSTDQTSAISKKTLVDHNIKGEVLFEPRQGKANAMRLAFDQIDADIYLMADADLTYPASEAKKIIQPIMDQEAEVVVGDRISNGNYAKENKRFFHEFGNNLVKFLINKIFGSNLKDIMSGYRAMSKRFIKLFPILSEGFEIETEMTLHALHKRYRMKEIPINYQDRPKGSKSKLNTFSDGRKVLLEIFLILKDYKPLTFFGIFSILFLIAGLITGIPVLYEYYLTQYITKVPSAILATGFMIFSFTSLSIGINLHSITRYHQVKYELEMVKFNLKSKR